MSASVTALQRAAGNRAVARLLAQQVPTRVRRATIQRTIEGYGPGDLAALCALLTDVGCEVSEKQDSPRLTKLKALLQDQSKRYEFSDVLELLGELPAVAEAAGGAAALPASSPASGVRERAPAPSSTPSLPPAVTQADLKAEIATNVRAVIVWAGSQIPAGVIARWKRFDLAALMKKHGNDAASVVQELDTNFKSQIQQALDQEREHPKAINNIISELKQLKITPVVFRPPTEQLLLGDEPLDRSWKPHWAGEQIDLLRANSATKTLLITVGHGTPEGETSFAGELLMGLTIATKLALGPNFSGRAFMYIPLQCFPQKAVARWKEGKETGEPRNARSIETGERPDQRSDDTEMQAWIRENLWEAVHDWLYDLNA